MDISIKEKLKEIINEYVKMNGTDTIMSKDKIRELIAQKYDDINPGSCQLTDYCYNMYNSGLKNFDKDCLLQVISKSRYRLLGSDYPYTGEVYHKPQKDGVKHLEGKWVRGKYQKLPQSQIENREKYLAEAEEEIIKIDNEIKKTGLEGAERDQIVKVRVNQSTFRQQLTNRYEHCCLCGVTNTSLLIASHIKPWAESDAKEKLDVNNGLLLCPNHDKLFDNGYITFDDNGEIIISDELDRNDQIFMNVNEKMSIDLYEDSKAYMKYHRENVFH